MVYIMFNFLHRLIVSLHKTSIGATGINFVLPVCFFYLQSACILSPGTMFQLKIFFTVLLKKSHIQIGLSASELTAHLYFWVNYALNRISLKQVCSALSSWSCFYLHISCLCSAFIHCRKDGVPVGYKGCTFHR